MKDLLAVRQRVAGLVDEELGAGNGFRQAGDGVASHVADCEEVGGLGAGGAVAEEVEVLKEVGAAA